MAPGYVDARSLAGPGNECAPYLVNYTYETLNHHAHGNRWPTLLASALRPDNAQGFGPVPMMGMRAEHFNRLAACVNLLRRIPVILPQIIQWRTRFRVGSMTAPNHAREGPFSRCELGSPGTEPSFSAVVSDNRYDSWFDPDGAPEFNDQWKDAAGNPTYGSCRQLGGSFEFEGGSVQHAIGHVYAGTPCASVPFDAYPPPPRNPLLLATEHRTFIRSHPGSPQLAALPAAVLDLMNQSSAQLHLLVNRSIYWATNAPGTSNPLPACSDIEYDMTGTSVGEVRLVTHNRYETRCQSEPMAKDFFGPEGVEVASEAGPPSTYVFTIDQGNCGVCVGGASGVCSNVLLVGSISVFVGP